MPVMNIRIMRVRMDPLLVHVLVGMILCSAFCKIVVVRVMLVVAVFMIVNQERMLMFVFVRFCEM
jgi:hypothetical protein